MKPRTLGTNLPYKWIFTALLLGTCCWSLDSTAAEWRPPGSVPRQLHEQMLRPSASTVAAMVDVEPASHDASSCAPKASCSQLPCSNCCGIRLQDEILLISARRVGCTCAAAELRSRLCCERFNLDASTDCGRWQRVNLASLLSRWDPSVPTVVFVHGNRISPGEDKRDGFIVYRQVTRCIVDSRPIRLIIFSWPSSDVRGILRDVRVKAARTRPAGCQLAWLLDQIPGSTRISLIGYSYGARVITGALHILGGGRLHGMGLPKSANPDRLPMRAVLIAAAVDSHWLGPGQYHGLAMSQLECMLLINNRRDNVMRLYPLVANHCRPQALGLIGPTCMGAEGSKILLRDVGHHVGISHDFQKYMDVPGTGRHFYDLVTWQY